MVFQGMQNLPILTAQSKDFFAKRGIELDVKLAPSSDEMRNGLAAGPLSARAQRGRQQRASC